MHAPPEAPPLLSPGPVHFDVYVRQRSHALLRLAFLVTGDAHLAEDLVQTALAKVSLRWDAVAGRGDPHGYVRAIVINTALGWRRRRWTGERPHSALPERSDPADMALGVDRRERLRVALVELPRRQRAAVVLRYYEDLSEAQVADLLGCSVGTVKSQTAKGLHHLRTLLGDEQP